MSNVRGLVPLALSRIGDLRGDEAKESALRILARALNEIQAPPETVADAFERIVSMSRAFTEKAARARAFTDACEAITFSILPLSRRRELLDHALDLALRSGGGAPTGEEALERIAAATAALDARIDVRWGERTEEVLAELEKAAAGIADEELRGRAVLHLSASLAKSGETDRALSAIMALHASGRRALGVARVAFALEREGLVAEAATLLEHALAEVREAPPSPERSLAFRGVLAHAVSTGIELGYHTALTLALDVADMMDDVHAQQAAILGAVLAIPDTAFEDEAFDAALARIEVSIGRVDDIDLRVGLRGRLSVSLAAIGALDASVANLRAIAEMVSWMRASGVEGPSVALPIALPILEILGVLAGVDFAPDALPLFASAALDLLWFLDDHRGVAGLLNEMTRFFASPALSYATRVALLDRTLLAAQRIEPDDARVEVVAHVADALSIAGATERGDALFTGLVVGIGPRRAREARLERALVLVRLGRTADARAEIAAASAATVPSFDAFSDSESSPRPTRRRSRSWP